MGARNQTGISAAYMAYLQSAEGRFPGRTAVRDRWEANAMPKQRYNELRAQKLIEEFERRGFEGVYCETKEEALKVVLRMLPEGCVVSCGGSATLHEIGLWDALKGGGYEFLDPLEGQGAAGKDRIAHEALAADYYLMSSNAISMTGELVNADGYGNRVASLIFGPKNVIVVAGLNKVEPDLDAAIRRTKERAAAMILLKNTNRDFASYDQLMEAADRIRSQLVVTSMTTARGRVKVVLVGEDLGY
jgi:hypothetical protein